METVLLIAAITIIYAAFYLATPKNDEPTNLAYRMLFLFLTLFSIIICTGITYIDLTSTTPGASTATTNTTITYNYNNYTFLQCEKCYNLTENPVYECTGTLDPLFCAYLGTEGQTKCEFYGCDWGEPDECTGTPVTCQQLTTNETCEYIVNEQPTLCQWNFTDVYEWTTNNQTSECCTNVTTPVIVSQTTNATNSGAETQTQNYGPILNAYLLTNVAVIILIIAIVLLNLMMGYMKKANNKKYGESQEAQNDVKI